MTDFHAIVVGAGPAGSAAAYHLARRGRRVLLLERKAFPRDKSCGDGLTLSAVRLLSEMGVVDRLPHAQEVIGLRVVMRGKGSRDFIYPRNEESPVSALVVPRRVLDAVIAQEAVAAGAELWQEAQVSRSIVESGVIVGVEVHHDGEVMDVRAPVVVAADGAASRLALQAGLAPPPEEVGVALRGYFEGLADLSEFLEIFVPLMDPSDRFLLPSYGWVFPTGPSTANVGVGLFRRQQGINIRELLEQFLAVLRDRDDRFSQAHLVGAWLGAPLRFDWSPRRSWVPGMVLVGDAAGLISPFTGEGISYALESGKLAAEAIDRNLDHQGGPLTDLSDYAVLLEQRYTGYFEAGRRSARRYLLVWHVLESTFDNDRPLFSLCRRAVLFPEAVGEPYASKILDDVSPLIVGPDLWVREDLLAVGEVMMSSLREDWPWLSRASWIGRDDPGIPFRPALLLLLAAYFGRPREKGLIEIGAAIELGYLAALAHLSVEDESPRPGDRSANGDAAANWGNMMAIMAGDALLSKAQRLSSGVSAGVTRLIADALALVCEGRMSELRTAGDPAIGQTEYVEMISTKTGTLFELPCRLGALVAGGSTAAVAALTAYGRALGIAFQIADDAYALVGTGSELGSVTRSDIAHGCYDLAIRLGLKGEQGPELRRLLRERPLDPEWIREITAVLLASGVYEQVLAVAKSHADSAREALRELPDGYARRSLENLATYALTRDVSRIAG